MKALIVSLVMLMASGVSYAEGKKFYGVGGYSCEVFQEMMDTSDDRLIKFKDWFQGYITHYNVVNDEQWALSMDRDLRFIYAECSKRPTEPVVFTINRMID